MLMPSRHALELDFGDTVRYLGFELVRHFEGVELVRQRL